VEMEVATLYAASQAKQYQIVCFAHVTNQMGQTEGDFEMAVRQLSPSSARRLTPGGKERQH
jgi:hypothetical protein